MITQDALASVDDIARLFTAALPQLDEDGGFDLLAATTMRLAICQVWAARTLRRLTRILIDGLVVAGRCDRS